MPLIQLTQADRKDVFVYVATEQICLVGDPAGAGPKGAGAHIRLANGDVFVHESVKEVMDKIQPGAAGT